jgi:AcrR family transcriptional regulator
VTPKAAVHEAHRVLGRPRDPSRDHVIMEATLELLAEEGYSHLSMEGVAHRAGVGKTTIYRRWHTKTALVVDALEQLSSNKVIPTGGTVRERLTQLLTEMLRHLRRGRGAQVMAALVGEIPRDPELAEAVRAVFLRKRQGTAFRLLQEGVANGELRPDLDMELAADLLMGPPILRRLLTGGPLEPDLAARIVAYLYDGWGA